MDDVFRALGDPRRRKLLDALREHDGQTLVELERRLPELTRFGVMRHVRVLEDARLITATREGRHKFHFLNPVPIRLLHDRWIQNYQVPVVEAMAGIKARAEGNAMSHQSRRYEIYIQATPEQVWQAITDPDLTRRYWFASLSRSEWTVGSRWRSESAEGELYLEGEILEIDPPRRLVHSFHIVHEEDAAAEAPSRLTWEIEAMGASCRLTVTHEDLGQATAAYVTGGWELILSGLKTVLETGRPLVVR